MIGALGSIFLLQINPGSEIGGESLIPGIPNHYISVSYARLVMDLAGKLRTVAFIVAAVLMVVSLAANSSGWLIKDLSIKEVLRSALITISLLVIWTPAFGVLMSFGYQIGESIVPEKEIRSLLVNAFRQPRDVDRNTPGQRAGDGPAGGGAGDVKSGGWLSWLLDSGGVLADLYTVGIVAIITTLCTLLFTIATFVMPTIWLIFATLMFIFGPIVISLGMLPRIGGKLLGNFFGAAFELSLWQAWFHICALLVIASNDLVNKKVTDLSTDIVSSGWLRPGEVDSAYTAAESAAMGLVFAGLYFATPLVVRHLVPVSQAGAATAAIISKASTVAGTAIGGVKGAVLGAAKTIGGIAGGMAAGGFGRGRGTAGGGLSGSGGSARGGVQTMSKSGVTPNPVPARVTKPVGASVTKPMGKRV